MRGPIAANGSDEIAGEPGTARRRGVRVADQRVLDVLPDEGRPSHVAPPHFARERGVQLGRHLDGEGVHGKMVSRSVTSRHTRHIRSRAISRFSGVGCLPAFSPLPPGEGPGVRGRGGRNLQPVRRFASLPHPKPSPEGRGDLPPFSVKWPCIRSHDDFTLAEGMPASALWRIWASSPSFLARLPRERGERQAPFRGERSGGIGRVEHGQGARRTVKDRRPAEWSKYRPRSSPNRRRIVGTAQYPRG